MTTMTKPSENTNHTSESQEHPVASDPRPAETGAGDDRTAARELRDLLDLVDTPAASVEARDATEALARDVLAAIHRQSSKSKAETLPGKSYETQPRGIPADDPVRLNGGDAYVVFYGILQAIKSWSPADNRVLPSAVAERRLLGLAEALVIVMRARITSMEPLIAAHRADAQAAEEWTRDRWFARSRSRATDAPIGDAAPDVAPPA